MPRRRPPRPPLMSIASWCSPPSTPSATSAYTPPTASTTAKGLLGVPLVGHGLLVGGRLRSPVAASERRPLRRGRTCARGSPRAKLPRTVLHGPSLKVLDRPPAQSTQPPPTTSHPMLRSELGNRTGLTPNVRRSNQRCTLGRRLGFRRLRCGLAWQRRYPH